MDKFIKYIEDKQFVRWVLRPNTKLDEHWRSFIEKNPAEKKHIEVSRLLVSQFKSKEQPESAPEVITLFSEIVSNINAQNKKTFLRRVGSNFLKYAAVAVLFFLIGVAVFNDWSTDRYAEFRRQEIEVSTQNDAQLILGDGNSILIEEKESTIEHSQNGRIIINKADTLSPIPEKQSTELNQLIVPYGKSSSIQLPDGTVAYLNAGSRLVYPSKFDSNKREVYLIGEGFFDVVHDPDRPFVAKTNVLDIKVLGTKFNLTAYPSDNFVETILVEGKVKVIETRNSSFLKNEYELEPNQLASFNRGDSEVKISNVDVLNYISWHNGYLNFDSFELSRIIRKLERYYNVKIELSDPLMGQKSISGKLKLKEDIESALRVLANSADMKLSKINETNYELK